MNGDLYTGLVIDGSTVEWASLHRTKNHFSPADAGREIATDALDADAAGDDEARNDAVAALLRKQMGRGRRPLSLGLPTEHVLLRVLHLPVTDADELAGVVELQVDKLSPFPVDSMVYSFEVLSQSEAGTRVLVAASRIAYVESLGRTLSSAGQTATRVDVAVLGLYRALREQGALQTEGMHVVAIMGAANVELMVLRDGIPLACRAVVRPPNATEDTFADELAREVGFTLVSLEMEMGESGEALLTIWQSPDEWQGLAAKVGEASGCVAESRSISELPAGVEGLARRLAEPGALDLTPASWTDFRSAKRFKKRLLIGIASVVLSWALLISACAGVLYYEQHRLDTLTAEFNTLHPPAQDVRALRGRVHMINRYMDRSNSALECLREISALQPAGIDLTSYSYRKGAEVRVSGEARAVAMVYDFRNKLDGSQLFLSATLDGPHRLRTGRQGFDVTLQLPEEIQ